jgi:CheY-like chemotaxis protein
MGATVLLIEDNLHDRSLVAFLLEAFGHTPIVASNGEQGLELLRTEDPDLVLMDILMPGMDGHDTLHAIRADPVLAEKRVVALTILSSPGQREALLAEGFDGYIPKPLLPEEFADRLDEHVPAKRRSTRTVPGGGR